MEYAKSNPISHLFCEMGFCLCATDENILYSYPLKQKPKEC